MAFRKEFLKKPDSWQDVMGSDLRPLHGWKCSINQGNCKVG